MYYVYVMYLKDHIYIFINFRRVFFFNTFYSTIITSGCFCPPEGARTIHVTVAGRRVPHQRGPAGGGHPLAAGAGGAA